MAIKNNPTLAPLVLGLFGAVASAQPPDLYDETTLRTIELSFAQPAWWERLIANYPTQTYLRADMKVDGVDYPGVGVRFKGNSSYTSVRNSQKKPFNIDVDAFNPGQELYGYEKLILNNGFKDPTFCREVISYRVMRRYLPASKANWVRLVINGESWGLYINIQHVGKDFMGEWFREDEGNRYKARVSGGSALTWLGSSPSRYRNSYELKSENNPNPWTDLIGVCNVLNNTPTQLLQSLDPIFSVERALWMIATTNVLCQADAYQGTGHNYYIFHDDHHGRMHTIPWDLNSSFGAFGVLSMSFQQKVNLDPFYRSSRGPRPLVDRVMTLGSARADYLAHIRTLLDEQYDWAVLGPLTTQYRTLIAAEVQADRKKLYTYQLFQQNFTQNVMLGPGAPGGNSLVPGLSSFVTARRNFLANHPAVNQPAPDVQQVFHFPARPTSAEMVWVNATVTAPTAAVGNVTLHHRVLGAFTAAPMFDDGMHNDGAAGDDVWGACIPAYGLGSTVDYYVRADTTKQFGTAAKFSPRSPEHRPYSYQVVPGPLPSGTVKINEFVAKNNTGIQDEAGEYEDWLELVNATAAPIVVSGMYLTDDIGNSTKWQIPPGYTLNPGGTLIVWCDEEPQHGPLHASFKISAYGEDLALFDTDGITPLDYIAFGPQVADIATGRLFDGLDPWVTFVAPTPGALNAPSGCGGRGYSALDPSAHTLSLGLSRALTVGAASALTVSGGPASTPHFGLIAAQPSYTPLAGTAAVLLLDPSTTVLLFQATSSVTGRVVVPVPVPPTPSLAGLVIYLQAVAVDGGGSLLASSALEATICP